NSFPDVAAPLSNTSVVVESLRVLRLDLRSVAELHTGFVEIAAGKVLLAAMQMTDKAGMGSATRCQNTRHQTPGCRQRGAARGFHYSIQAVGTRFGARQTSPAA